MCPREAVSLVALRIQDSEASLGEKLFLFETIGNAAQALADLNQRESMTGPSKEKSQLKADNDFFGID